MLKPALAPAIETMIDHDLVFDAGDAATPRCAATVGLYPELRLVVDH
jgi:hypothetical protein